MILASTATLCKCKCKHHELRIRRQYEDLPPIIYICMSMLICKLHLLCYDIFHHIGHLVEVASHCPGDTGLSLQYWSRRVVDYGRFEVRLMMVLVVELWFWRWGLELVGGADIRGWFPARLLLAFGSRTEEPHKERGWHALCLLSSYGIDGSCWIRSADQHLIGDDMMERRKRQPL